MDGDSIPRCTIAARSLRRVLLQESREYVGVPSPQLVATSVVYILRSGAAQPHEDNAENGRRGEQHTAK